MVFTIADQVAIWENKQKRAAGETRDFSIVIDPRTSTWIGYWDGVTSLALIFTAIITPVEVGFMEAPTTWEARLNDGLFITNRVVDCIFIYDMLLQFFTMYPAEDETSSSSSQVTGGSHWVGDVRSIARHYMLSKWFVLDSTSIGVSLLDVFGGAGDGAGASRIAALRAVRVLRLLKLVRLARGSRIFKRWEMRLSINYGLLQIAGICWMLIFVCHLFACVWGLQANFDPLGTWLGQKGYCVAINETHFNGDDMGAGYCPTRWSCDWRNGVACASAEEQYLYSLYWAIATVTSIGYGDVVATPLHGVEQLLCVAMMLSGSLLFAYLVGSFCGLAANLAPDVVKFRQDLTDLNKFLTANAIPSNLRYQLREYMHQTVFLRRAATGNRLLSDLAPKLRNEVALTMNERWLHKIDLINDECEQGLVLELAFALSLQIFPPGDNCPVGRIYIVSRGAALFAGRAKVAGDSWGEAEALLVTDRLRFPVPASALAYLFTYSIDGETIRVTMSQSKYPEASFRLRRRQVQWIVRRGVVRLAEEKLAQRQARFSTRKSLFVPRHIGASKLTGLIEAARAASKGNNKGAAASVQKAGTPRIGGCKSPKPGSKTNGDDLIHPELLKLAKERSRESTAEIAANTPIFHGTNGGLGNGTSLDSSFQSRGRNDSSELPGLSVAGLSGEVTKLQADVLDLKRAQRDDSHAIREMLGQLLSRHDSDAVALNPAYSAGKAPWGLKPKGKGSNDAMAC